MRLNKLTNKVYYADYVSNGDRPVLGLVIGKKHSLIIDAGNSKAHTREFIQEAKKIATSPIKYLVITHWHWDHVFGIYWAKKEVDVTICNSLTDEKIKYLQTLKWDYYSLGQRVRSGEEIEFCMEHMKIEMPDLDDIIIDRCDLIFNNKISIDLGGIVCEVLHIGGDHSSDSSIVIVNDNEKSVFLGDCLYLDMYHGNWSFSREKLYPMLKTLLSIEASWYIPSHHNMYSYNGFKGYVKYLKGIGDIVGNITKYEKAIEEFQKYKFRDASEEESYDIICFVEGNRKKFKQ